MHLQIAFFATIGHCMKLEFRFWIDYIVKKEHLCWNHQKKPESGKLQIIFKSLAQLKHYWELFQKKKFWENKFWRPNFISYFWLSTSSFQSFWIWFPHTEGKQAIFLLKDTHKSPLESSIFFSSQTKRLESNGISYHSSLRLESE